MAVLFIILSKSTKTCFSEHCVFSLKLHTSFRLLWRCCIGSSCLELGCGAGVVGVALCRTGAATVQLTDGNGAAVDNCKHNLEINNCIPPQHLCTTQLAGCQSQHTQVGSSLQSIWSIKFWHLIARC